MTPMSVHQITACHQRCSLKNATSRLVRVTHLHKMIPPHDCGNIAQKILTSLYVVGVPLTMPYSCLFSSCIDKDLVSGGQYIVVLPRDVRGTSLKPCCDNANIRCNYSRLHCLSARLHTSTNSIVRRDSSHRAPTLEVM